MKEVPLTKGKVALVDDADFEEVNKFSWFPAEGHNGVWYARRMTADRKWRRMHREILGITDSRIQVDHRDVNGLNNQRDNLRLATAGQQKANTRRRSDKKRGSFKGVFPAGSKWIARLGVSGQTLNLGTYSTEEEAAEAYAFAARQHFGEFARCG